MSESTEDLSAPITEDVTPPTRAEQIAVARAVFIQAQQELGPQHPQTLAAGMTALKLLRASR